MNLESAQMIILISQYICFGTTSYIGKMTLRRVSQLSYRHICRHT